MKSFKKEISFLLIIALVFSSLVLGVGQLKSSAYTDAPGTSRIRAIIHVKANDEYNHLRGTNSGFDVRFLNVTGGTVASFNIPDGPENNETITYTSPGQVTVNKAIVQCQLIEVTHSDEFCLDWIQYYYESAANTWTLVASDSPGGYITQFNGVGMQRTVSTTWFTNNVKTLAFNANGGRPSAYYDAIPGQTITAPANPERTGYTFAGWSPALPARMPNTNTTYTAQWTPNQYTITFDANGGTGGTSQSLACGSTLTPPAVERTGYTFIAWSPSVPANVPAVDRTYTAIWVPIGWTIGLCKITFNPNGGSGTMYAQNFYNGQTKALSNNEFAKTGRTFVGWATSQAYADAGIVEYLNGENYSIGLLNITLYAVWTANVYAIIFDANGGTGGTSVAMTSGEPLTPPTVLQAGYTLIGWSPALPATVPTANTTYTAQWTANQYTVTFDAQGGTVAPSTSTVTYGSTYGAGTGGFPTPTRTGYTFGGWYTGTNGSGSNRLSTTTVSTTAAHTLYAKWTGISYTVAYNGNGSTAGSTASSTHTYGTAKTLTANGFTKTGYAFTGWATSPDGDVVYSDTQSVINLSSTQGATVTLYAKWTNVNVATITFDANGGTGGKSTTLIIGATLIAPTVTRTGYTFTGWTPTLPSTVPAADTTYTAQWSINSYTIRFNANGGTGGTSVSMQYGMALTAPTVTRIGYTFFGWWPEYPSNVPAADSTYTAYWTAKTFTVTFNPQSGTVSPTTSTVTYDSTYSSGTGGFPTPARMGYTFGGWYTGTGGTGTKILSTTTVKIIAAQTLYAYWTSSTGSVIITFDANGGTGGTSTTRTAGEALLAPTVARAGFIFTGWLPSVPPTVPDADSTYIAQWVPGSTDFTYTVDNGQATVTKYNGIGGNVTIPAMLGGYPVTGIKGYRTAPLAYVGIFYECTVPTVVTIPGSVTIIDEYAFKSCSKLTGITIPSSVISINKYAFSACTGLSILTIPDSVTIISDFAFSSCINLTQINVDSGNSSFASQDGVLFNKTKTVLINCPQAKTGDYTIPAGVTAIGNYAFNRCENITSVTFPDSLTAIGTEVFNLCASMNRYIVGVGNNAFSCQDDILYDKNKTQLIQCPYNKSGNYVIPNTVVKISDFAFGDCSKLTGIVIPNSVTTIGVAAFTDCSGLTGVSIPDSVTTLWEQAFWGCSGLTSVRLGSGLSVIGDCTFSICSNLISAYFYGNAPTLIGSSVFGSCASGFTVYHLPYVNGFTSPTWYTYPTAVFTPVNTIITFDANGGTGGTSTSMNIGAALTAPTFTRTGYTFSGWSPTVPSTVPAANTTYTAQWSVNSYTIIFDANGGTGGTSASMTYGSPLTAPAVSKPGYVFTGWSPAVPSTVPAVNTTYTAQFTKTAVNITKLAEGFKVNIQGWAAGNKYQIWSYQSITSDLFSGGTASQWILSKSYTLGSSGTAETDGSISFTIDDFVSPDSNYTIAVRITDASGNYLGEIRDSYTPTDVSEVKIAKVLVDSEYSTGKEIREIITGAAMTFTVIGNNVPGTVITAKVVESGTVLTANSAVEFGWDISALTPGIYTVQFTATNGATMDAKNITVQLYSLDTGIQYGAISELGLTAIEDNTLPKALTINPDFTNGSFYYRVGEPGRKAIFTSGLFDPADSIEYTFTKYGVYQVSGFVNREYEVRIGSNFDDGYIKQFVVSRSQTEPSTATLTAGSVDLSNPIQKLTEIRFEADAQIGGIGSTPVQYSFWRYDAKGYALVKDWSSDNTLDWTPARVGNYTIEVRAKGSDAGSYEVAKSVKVTVTDGTDQIAQDVAITLNEAELNANATARAPITVKANAISSNSEDLLYKFYVTDAAMGTSTLQAYSADSNCIWTPRKAGTYTISVLVKNNASYGAYDAMESFEITVN